MAFSKQFAHVCVLALMHLAACESHFLNRGQVLEASADHPDPVALQKDDEEQKADKPDDKKYKGMFEVADEGKKKAEVKAKELTGKEKYPVIHALHNRLAKVFAKSSDNQLMDWKLWVGLSLWVAVWVKWLIHGYDENNEVYYERSLFVFGVNILILHILQFAPSIGQGLLFVCAVLAAQNLFQNYLSFKTQNAEYETPRAEEWVCDTVYLDLSLPLEQIVILFVAQCGVWWFYMTSILGNFDFSHVNYLFWFWAFLAMQITMIFNRGEDSVLGNAFPVHSLWRLVLKADNVMFQLAGDNDKKGQFKKSRADLIARGVMGFFCNSILREIMSYTIPLMLMGFSEPMDFVVYCVGVNFICTLDDMGEKTFALSSRMED